MTLVDPSAEREAPPADAAFATRVGPYVSRMLIQHLAANPDQLTWSSEGSAAFIDISGFTKLSEALARQGRVGAEQVAESIGHVRRR